MNQHLIAYISTAIVFLVIDFVWLTQIASKFYSEQLGDLLLEKPNLGIAVAFYLIYVVGIVVFAVAPALKAGSFQYAVLYGAMFGFFAYATYDLTNLATLKNWSVAVALVDVSWGTVLTGVAAGAGYAITNTFSNNL